MKKIALILITILTALSLYGQDITGLWNGILKVQGLQLRVILYVTQTDKGYSSTMYSHDQGAYGIVVTSTSFENPALKFEVANALIEYEGFLDKDNPNIWEKINFEAKHSRQHAAN